MKICVKAYYKIKTEMKLNKDIVVIGNCEYILDESKEKEKKIMCLDLY